MLLYVVSKDITYVGVRRLLMLALSESTLRTPGQRNLISTWSDVYVAKDGLTLLTNELRKLLWLLFL